MALNAYLTLKGQKQGDIKGSVAQKGREGSILIHAYSNEIISPRDAASGLATGKRQHKAITLLKENDRSSPLLWNAFTANENLATWELRFWSPSPNGTEAQTYTVRLTNASISSIREVMLDNSNPDLTRYPLREEISFVYQKITWIWTDGGITAQDDWETPIT